MSQGHCFTTWNLPNQDKDPAWAHAPRKSYEDQLEPIRFRGITYKQFLDGLDKLFADHRNRKIAVQNGMWIVMSEICGQPSGTRESMIEAWRQKAAEES